MTASRAAVLAVVLLAALAPAPARANIIGPYAVNGSAAGEPVALAGLRVARERLTLDLRPLARRRNAVVEAHYLIVNEGAVRRVPLVFVALGPDDTPAEVWLDGVPVAASRMDSLDVPEAWRVATTMPSLDGAAAPPRITPEGGALETAGFAFTLDVPPGRHAIRVRYRVEPGVSDDGAHPNAVRQVAYSLAPARFWAGFGSLDVTVHVPEGWDAAASLPLRREGHALVATFAGVPGDVLAVSARAPAPAGRRPIRAGGFALALGLCVLAGWLGGTVTARRGRSVRWAWLVSLAGAAAATALLLAATSWAASLGDSEVYVRGQVFTALIYLAPLALVVGTLLAQTVAVRTHRRRLSA